MDLAAVLAPEDTVNAYLKTSGQSSPAGCLSTQPDRTLVIYEESTGDFTRIQEISAKLGVPVFALHVHDDDLWLYEFYVDGELKDRFNTIPEYWQELCDEEKASWKGNAQILATHWKDLKPEDISAYLINWHEGLGEDDDMEDGINAYPDDEFPIGDFWQLTDFLKKLGTPYPDEQEGEEEG